MNTIKIFICSFFISVAAGFAQDINQAKVAIDAEKYDNAKSVLKTILKTTTVDGRANFTLGNIYLLQSVVDSAKIVYQKGLGEAAGARLNYVGLGSLDLYEGNATAAESNFSLALSNVKKKDIEELIAIGRAYTSSVNPNYKKAIEYLTKAITINPNDALVNLALGDAHYGDKNQNDAYLAYRKAFDLDPTMLRAKMQMGVLLKGAKNYDEAIKSFDAVIATNPTYGPVYRELAETFYKWGRNKPSKSAEYMKTAIGHYEKYLTLTDYSLNSRMRHADFLILVKDYKELEIEANKMSEMDKVNPRIFRYLGYSAYENGNVDTAIKALESFIFNPTNKVISRDYLYLANAKLKKGISADGLSIDATLYDAALADLKKAVELESGIIEDFGESGKKLFNLKLFKEAGPIFEFGTTNPEFKNYTEDNIYYGLSIYYANNKKDVVPDAVALQKADAAFGNVNTVSPNYQDAYLYRGRTNSLIGNDELTIKYYEAYIEKVTIKGPEELAKPAVVKKIIESYNTIGASYANTDKVKAVEFFNKTLLLEPANAYATESIAKLKI
jgi:tetratricopeptide (TPR) repeat protein